jgi:hypothetical protein
MLLPLDPLPALWPSVAVGPLPTLVLASTFIGLAVLLLRIACAQRTVARAAGASPTSAQPAEAA